jgi:hypothetical protein
MQKAKSTQGGRSCESISAGLATSACVSVGVKRKRSKKANDSESAKLKRQLPKLAEPQKNEFTVNSALSGQSWIQHFKGLTI